MDLVEFVAPAPTGQAMTLELDFRGGEDYWQDLFGPCWYATFHHVRIPIPPKNKDAQVVTTCILKSPQGKVLGVGVTMQNVLDKEDPEEGCRWALKRATYGYLLTEYPGLFRNTQSRKAMMSAVRKTFRQAWVKNLVGRQNRSAPRGCQ